MAKKIYIAIRWDEVLATGDTSTALLETLADDYSDVDFDDVEFYEAVKGVYVPPSTPATIKFGDK